LLRITKDHTSREEESSSACGWRICRDS
jgi:hypothetical protein